MENKDEQSVLVKLGINHLASDKKNELLNDYGQILIEASIGRLLLSLENSQLEKLESYLENVTDDEDVIAYLLRTYPEFQPIVEEEAKALEAQTKEALDH
jgi:hypothetical protein